MSSPADILAPVAARLRGLRRALIRLFAIDGFARLLLGLGGFVVATFALDWALILPPGVRLALLAAGIGLLGWIAVRRILHPLRLAVSDDDLALFVERRHPELGDRLISAIQLARSSGPDPDGAGGVSNSPELVRALAEDAARASGGLDFGAALSKRRVVRRAAAGAFIALLLAAGTAWNPSDYASIYFNRVVGGNRPWPQRTHLAVLDFDEDGRRVVARGDDLAVAVQCGGRRPSRVVLQYAFATGEEGRERMIPAEGDRFQYTFSRVTGPFTFTVSGGDAVTPTFSVETVTPPALESIRVFLHPPAYMRRPDTSPETSGSVTAPFHTQVRFEARANEDLEEASLVLGREEAVPLEISLTPEGHPRLLSGGFEVKEAGGTYEIRLKALNGLSNREPIRFPIRGLEDVPPQIAVRDPLGDEFVTAACKRPLEAEVEDDHGVARIVLESRVLAQQEDREKEWVALPLLRADLSADYGEGRIRVATTFDVAALDLRVGDHVELRLRAEDFKDVDGANVRLSRVYKLSVVSLSALEKELQDAIEKIKALLKTQQNREEAAWDRTGRLLAQHAGTDLLGPEARGELRQAGLEQNDVTTKLDTARRDIAHVRRRGVYNGIYNEGAAGKLQAAMDELVALSGDPGDPTRPGIARVAAAALDQSARLETAAARSETLLEAQRLQSAVAEGVRRALDHLDKWSTYQEVIRLTREVLDRQKGVNERIKGIGGGRNR